MKPDHRDRIIFPLMTEQNSSTITSVRLAMNVSFLAVFLCSNSVHGFSSFLLPPQYNIQKPKIHRRLPHNCKFSDSRLLKRKHFSCRSGISKIFSTKESSSTNNKNDFDEKDYETTDESTSKFDNNEHSYEPVFQIPGSKQLHHIATRIQMDVSHVAEGLTFEAGNPITETHKPSVHRSLVSNSPQWKRLKEHRDKVIRKTHLRELLQDQKRSDEMYVDYDGVYLDYSRQQVTKETMELLTSLAERQNLQGKIDAMMRGERINFTENRAVLHTALRAKKDDIGKVFADGDDVVKEVHEVLDQVKYFTEGVRSGRIRGYTGKHLRNIISVGIGGSYLGPEFLHEVLKTEPEGVNSSLGYSLRFLSNVDPVDVERTCSELDPEETLVVIVSKTFQTAETMLNARTMRQWLWDFMGNDPEVVRKHMMACSSITSTELVVNFGINTDDYFFRFWDWVGGRYSLCSSVGAVPISLMYGFDIFQKFLDGANSIDEHFVSAPFEKNIPVIMGFLGVWNMSFMNYCARTTLPYAEALLKLPAHIQQLDMESNGKHVTRDGLEIDYPVGEIDFGEPGTNGQHSFFQLLHMGQAVPCDFIGFVTSQHDLCIDGEKLSSHDELMANFFAQPDALANGKPGDVVRSEGVAENLVIHRTFEGNRPSLSLLLPKLTAYATGQLLAIYEHRTAVQGFIWDINSFDQWGVELGKQLAGVVKENLFEGRMNPDEAVEASNPSTTRLLNYYINNSRDINCDLAGHSGLTSLTRNAPQNSKRVTDSMNSRPIPSRNDLTGKNGKL